MSAKLKHPAKVSVWEELLRLVRNMERYWITLEKFDVYSFAIISVVIGSPHRT
jgi:hypothetical protein